MRRRSIAQSVRQQRHPSRVLRLFDVPSGLPTVGQLREELEGYWDILLGRVDPPVSAGIATLMEVANALYSRAKEIESLIDQLEATGRVPASHPHARFRKTELRRFIEMSSKAVELGSRRITVAQMEAEMRQG